VQLFTGECDTYRSRSFGNAYGSHLYDGGSPGPPFPILAAWVRAGRRVLLAGLEEETGSAGASPRTRAIRSESVHWLRRDRAYLFATSYSSHNIDGYPNCHEWISAAKYQPHAHGPVILVRASYQAIDFALRHQLTLETNLEYDSGVR
jgi:hypothetical protein